MKTHLPRQRVALLGVAAAGLAVGSLALPLTAQDSGLLSDANIQPGMVPFRLQAELDRLASLAQPDSATVAAVVDGFHDALAAGDSAVVADFLAPDATVLENGSVETREEYLGGHLHGDIAFAQAVPRERGAIQVVVEGDVAWATSTSVVRGEFRGRDVNSAAAELMVLRRMPDAWRVAAIHWSSRQLRP